MWNAEYRVSLTRNYDILTDPRKEDDQSSKDDVKFGSEKGVSEGLGDCAGELERMSPPQVFRDLSPEALSYIQELQSELTSIKEVILKTSCAVLVCKTHCEALCSCMLVLFQELDLQKKKALQIECEKGSKNDLLEYLRSLDSEMVRNVYISL